MNFPNPDENNVADFAKYMKELAEGESGIVFLEKTKDDPTQRKPVIDLAKENLGTIKESRSLEDHWLSAAFLIGNAFSYDAYNKL